MMNNKTFANKAIDIAKNYKSLYVTGAFGAPALPKNKTRYTNNYPQNQKEPRKSNILNASADTFFFDCTGLIKAILWGWNGNKNAVYGGAQYNSNGVPDFEPDGMIARCSGVSTDFKSVEVGEVLWLKGHAGIYIGDGLAVECSPAWQNKVQITAVANIGKKAGYNARTWTKHGMLPYVEYIKEVTPAPVLDANVKFAEMPTLTYDEKLKKITSRGLAVKMVQAVVGVSVDGEYGKLSKAAVEKWQKTNGLTVDGVFGKNSWIKLGNLAK